MGMLEGKIAIVTGSGHGIGRGHAMELAKHGAKTNMPDACYRDRDYKWAYGDEAD